MPQSLAKLYVHIIFSTKNRTLFLDDENIRNQMYAYLASILKEFGCPALIIGGTVDHIHILCTLSKVKTLADIIREIKRNSSKWIKTKGAQYPLDEVGYVTLSRYKKFPDKPLDPGWRPGKPGLTLG